MPNFLKKASSYFPFLRDQGIDNILGTDLGGDILRRFTVTMPAGGVVTFASLGFKNMSDTAYTVLASNHTGTVDPVVSASNRRTTGITITGPTTGDLLDFVIVGHVLGVASK